MKFALNIAIGYLLGSIPFGYLIARLGGVRDVRQSGSGNIGAANIARTIGLPAGVLTLLLDSAKGALAVWIASRLSHGLSAALIEAGLSAILGHMFPVWLRFRGGRGVATALGAFAVIGPLAVAVDTVIWIGAAMVWRYASLSSILWAAALPFAMYCLYLPGMHPPPEVSVGTIMAAVFILWRHRGNLRRLVDGTEPHITFHR